MAKKNAVLVFQPITEAEANDWMKKEKKIMKQQIKRRATGARLFLSLTPA